MVILQYQPLRWEMSETWKVPTKTGCEQENACIPNKINEMISKLRDQFCRSKINLKIKKLINNSTDPTKQFFFLFYHSSFILFLLTLQLSSSMKLLRVYSKRINQVNFHHGTFIVTLIVPIVEQKKIEKSGLYFIWSFSDRIIFLERSTYRS